MQLHLGPALFPVVLSLGLAAPSAAQSWDQHLVAGQTETGLVSGLAATPTVFAFGQPQHNPYSKPEIFDVVRVFELQAGSFVEVAELTSAEPIKTNASFGVALAIDGDLLAVGDPAAPGPGFTSGAVHLYRRGPGGWALEQVVRPVTVTTSALEFGVSLDLEGGRLVVGAPTSTIFQNSLEDGTVYIYDETPSGFVEVQRIDPPGTVLAAHFGRDLDLEGNRLLVGAPGGLAGGEGYLYENSPGSFALIDTFAPAVPGGQFGQFGRSVALAGTLAAFGSLGVASPSAGSGRVYVFEDQGAWTEVAQLENSSVQSYDLFGSDLEFEGGSLFVTNESSCSAQRFDQGPAVWEHAESYISSSGLTWTPRMPVRVRSVSGQVWMTDPLGATVFQREVPAELEVNCPGDPHPLSAFGSPVTLDVRGQLSLSEPTLPVLLVYSSGLGNGLLFYGFGAASKPFGGSTLCVQGPVARTVAGNETGPGSSFLMLDLDLQSKPVSMGSKAILPGVDTYFQYWFRVPGAGTTHLSSSLRMVFAP